MTQHGYIRIELDNRKYMAHRLAWLYMFGKDPDAEIDHINGNRSDNRLANLREAIRSENMQNKGKYRNNSSGLTGVSWSKVRNKWAANIQAGNVQKNLGFFSTKEEAYLAYLKAKAEKHAFHPMTRA